MGYSGARGTLIYEKNLMSKISCQTPFKEPRNQGIKVSIPPAYVAWRDGTSNRVVVYRPARAGNRSLDSLKCWQIRAQQTHKLVNRTAATKAGGIDSLESIPGLLKRMQIRAQTWLFYCLVNIFVSYPKDSPYIHLKGTEVRDVILQFHLMWNKTKRFTFF